MLLNILNWVFASELNSDKKEDMKRKHKIELFKTVSKSIEMTFFFALHISVFSLRKFNDDPHIMADFRIFQTSVSQALKLNKLRTFFIHFVLAISMNGSQN